LPSSAKIVGENVGQETVGQAQALVLLGGEEMLIPGASFDAMNGQVGECGLNEVFVFLFLRL
jgi:hypothetical protein